MPTLLLFKGHPGSGKSTLSRSLSRRLKWPVIDKDDSKDVLLTPSHKIAESVANDIAYSTTLRIAETQLECHLSVIVDSPSARIQLFREASAIAAKNHAEIAVVECYCSDQEEWKQRLSGRPQAGKEHKPRTWQDLEALLKRYNGCNKWSKDLPDVQKCLLDTSKSTVDEAREEVVSFLKKARLFQESARIDPEDSVFLNSG